MVSKKKSSNPLDAHRKAARSRELQKNKDQRDKAREISLVKRDTLAIEKEIQQLQNKKARTQDEDEGLGKLLSEIKRITHAKEEYLSKHPEHRHFVYPTEAEEKAQIGFRKNREGENGRSSTQSIKKDPRRSVYYDETFNPFGAPPPGMPYLEKTDEQWEAEQRRLFEGSFGLEQIEYTRGESDSSSSDEEDDDDDGIVMPEGPSSPPLPISTEVLLDPEVGEEEGDTSEDEDGIVMPKGPPPRPPTAPKAMLQATKSNQHYPHSPAPFQPPLPPLPSKNRPSVNNAPRSFQEYHSFSMSPKIHQGSVPSQPSIVNQAATAPIPAQKVITSEPVLRDLKKEATAFVPTALRRKQAAARSHSAKEVLSPIESEASSNER